MLEPGTPAPSFTALDESERPVSLADFRGRFLVLYFYPGDARAFCATEAKEFESYHAWFSQVGATIVGVSRDPPSAHGAFRRQCGLTFPLLSDVDGAMHKAYHADSILGGTRRVTYVIDEAAVVRSAFISRFFPKAHARQAVGFLRDFIPRSRAVRGVLGTLRP